MGLHEDIRDHDSVPQLGVRAAMPGILVGTDVIPRPAIEAARLHVRDVIRRQVIAECEKRVRRLEHELQDARAETRNQAYRIQRLFAIGLADVLAEVRDDPGALPPDVEEALERIRQLLQGQAVKSKMG